MRIIRWLCTLSAILLVLMRGRESLAHHSFAMYDMNKVVVITGTVKEFQWTNPHALLWVTGTVDGGAADLWAIELPTSPGNLGRMGWTKHSLATGDLLALEINPLRDGSHGGSFKKATLTKTGVVLVANPFKDADGGGYPSADLDGSTDDAGTPEAGEAGTAAGGEKAAGCSLSGGAGAGLLNWGPGLLGVLAIAMGRRMACGRGKRRRGAAETG